MKPVDYSAISDVVSEHLRAEKGLSEFDRPGEVFTAQQKLAISAAIISALMEYDRQCRDR